MSLEDRLEALRARLIHGKPDEAPEIAREAIVLAAESISRLRDCEGDR